MDGMVDMTKPFAAATTPLDGTLAELTRDDVVMETIWSRDFDKTNPRKAIEAWSRFRLDVLAQHSVLNEKLKQLQSECEDVRTIKDIMDLEHVVERKDSNNAICMKLAKIDEEVQKVSLLMETFAQYLPSGPHRAAIEAPIQDILEQFLHLVRQTNKRTELLNWIAPHLQRYLTAAGEVKTWLAHAEARCKYLTTLSITSMNCEAVVEKLVDEMIEKKVTHDAMHLAYRGVVVVDGLEQFFNVHSNNLAKDKAGVLEKWDHIKETLTNYLSEISTEKRTQIDNQLKMECQHCCCSMPYEIKKVGENRYTFGTSKTVRMVRQHGQSIVVRVGGGWEYLINFLSKVDPCRAKELAQDYIDNGEVTAGNGVVLKSMDAPDVSFQRPVVRLTKSVMPPKKKGLHTKTTPKTAKVSTISSETADKKGGTKKKPGSKSLLKPTSSPRSASTSDDRLGRGRPAVPGKKRTSKSQSAPPKDEKQEHHLGSSLSDAESERSFSETTSLSPRELPDESLVIDMKLENPVESAGTLELETIPLLQDEDTPERRSRSSTMTKDDRESTVVITPAADDELLDISAQPPTIQIKKRSSSPNRMKSTTLAKNDQPSTKVITKDVPPISKNSNQNRSPTSKTSNRSRSKSPIALTKERPTNVNKTSIKNSPAQKNASDVTLKIPASGTKMRGRSADFTVGRAPSPSPRPAKTSTSREGRPKTSKVSNTTRAESVPKPKSIPKAESVPKRQRSQSSSVLDPKDTPPKVAITAAKAVSRVGAKTAKSNASPTVKPKSGKTAAVKTTSPSSSTTSSEQVKAKRHPAKTSPVPHKDDSETKEKSDKMDSNGKSVDLEASSITSIETKGAQLDLNQEKPLDDSDLSADTTITLELKIPSTSDTIETTNEDIEPQEEGNDVEPNAEISDDIHNDSLTSPTEPVSYSNPESLFEEFVAAEMTPGATTKNPSNENIPNIENDEDLVTLMSMDKMPHNTVLTDDQLPTPDDSRGPEFHTNPSEEELCRPTPKVDNSADEELVVIDLVENPESCPPDIERSINSSPTFDSLSDPQSLEPSNESIFNKVEHDVDDVFVKDLFSTCNTTEADDDAELTVPNLFAAASEDIVILDEPYSPDEGDIFPTTRTDRASSFEYIIDVNDAKIPLGDMQNNESDEKDTNEDVGTKPENNAEEKIKDDSPCDANLSRVQMMDDRRYSNAGSSYKGTDTEDEADDDCKDDNVEKDTFKDVTTPENNAEEKIKDDSPCDANLSRVQILDDRRCSNAGSSYTGTDTEDKTDDDAIDQNAENDTNILDTNSNVNKDLDEQRDIFKNDKVGHSNVSDCKDKSVPAESNNISNDDSKIVADLEMESIESDIQTESEINTATAILSGDKTSVDNVINNNCEEPIVENGLDDVDTDELSHKILESIVESGQHFLDSIECEDGKTGEKTTLIIGSNTPLDSTSLELSSKSVDSSSCKPPVNAPAETWVVF